MSALTYNEKELEKAARFILDKAQHRILRFTGVMGAGKTTLIKKVIALLGSEDSGSSPTFSLVNEYYTANGPVYHFDLYRLNDEEEAYAIGLEEYLDSGHWCLVEWPERAPGIFPEETTLIDIKILLNGKREVGIR